MYIVTHATKAKIYLLCTAAKCKFWDKYLKFKYAHIYQMDNVKHITTLF